MRILCLLVVVAIVPACQPRTGTTAATVKGLTVEPAGEVRPFDRAALAELEMAFQDNPVTARTTYAAVRWRITGNIRDIHETGSVVVELNGGPVAISLPQSELAQLRAGKSAVIVATLRNVGWADRTSAQFKNGKVIDP
jgi:hypothetical protein